jgi:hypothetical protein
MPPYRRLVAARSKPSSLGETLGYWSHPPGDLALDYFGYTIMTIFVKQILVTAATKNQGRWGGTAHPWRGCGDGESLGEGNKRPVT